MLILPKTAVHLQCYAEKGIRYKYEQHDFFLYEFHIYLEQHNVLLKSNKEASKKI